MDRGIARVGRFLFSRASTWLALAVLAVFHILFTWWFSPSLPMHGLAVLVELASLALGVALTLSSPAFSRYVNRMPFEERGRELKRLLPGCTPRFRELAHECIALTERIRAEFKDKSSDDEIGAIIGNLRLLSEANGELLQRSRAFGTREQKEAMDRLLGRQESSLETMHGQLKAFSGNLTLLEARTEQQAAPTDDLRFINQGLEEAIKELDK